MKIIEYGGWGKKMEIPSRTMGIWSCWTASPTVHSDAVLITVVGVSWAFLMVITLVSSKFSQALQKKNVHLPLSEKVEGYGRPYQRQLSLSATQRKNKGSCVFQHRDYNTVLEFWQQQTAAGILQKSGKSEAILTCFMGSKPPPSVVKNVICVQHTTAKARMRKGTKKGIKRCADAQWFW